MAPKVTHPWRPRGRYWGQGKSKRAEKKKMARRKAKNGEIAPLYFFSRHFFPARLDFPLPPLSALPWVSEGESNDEKIRKQNEIDAKEIPLMICILF